jgi:hypothetical protein
MQCSGQAGGNHQLLLPPAPTPQSLQRSNTKPATCPGDDIGQLTGMRPTPTPSPTLPNKQTLVTIGALSPKHPLTQAMT